MTDAKKAGPVNRAVSAVGGVLIVAVLAWLFATGSPSRVDSWSAERGAPRGTAWST